MHFNNRGSIFYIFMRFIKQRERGGGKSVSHIEEVLENITCRVYGTFIARN